MKSSFFKLTLACLAVLVLSGLSARVLAANQWGLTRVARYSLSLKGQFQPFETGHSFSSSSTSGGPKFVFLPEFQTNCKGCYLIYDRVEIHENIAEPRVRLYSSFIGLQTAIRSGNISSEVLNSSEEIVADFLSQKRFWGFTELDRFGNATSKYADQEVTLAEQYWFNFRVCQRKKPPFQCHSPTQPDVFGIDLMEGKLRKLKQPIAFGTDPVTCRVLPLGNLSICTTLDGRVYPGAGVGLEPANWADLIFHSIGGINH